MSCSLWGYEEKKCEGRPCPRDCDHCQYSQEEIMTKESLLQYIDSQTGNGSMGVLMIRNYVERNMLSGLAFRCPNCDELIFWKGEKHCPSCGCELEDGDDHEQNLKAYAHDFDCTIEEAEKALRKEKRNE